MRFAGRPSMVFFSVWAVATTAQFAAADSAAGQYAMAAGLYDRQRWSMAAEQFQAFLDDYPDHPRQDEALYYLAEALLQQDRHAEANRRYRDYVKRFPDGPFFRQALFRSGESAYLSGDLADARSLLSQFVERFPRHALNAYVLVYQGDIALKLDDPAAAEGDFRGGLRRFPQGKLQDDCRFGLARALEKLGRVDEARRYYLAVSAKTSSHLADDALFHLGSLQYAQGDYPAAVESFRPFAGDLKQSPHAPMARLGHAWALIKLKQYDQAAGVLESIRTLDTVGPEATYWLGIIHKTRQRWTDAADILDRAARQYPQHRLASAMRFHAGSAYHQGGRREDARTAFEAVLQTPAEDQSWHDDAIRGLVRLALETDDNSETERLAGEFMRRFPDSPLRFDVLRMVVRCRIEQKQFDRAEATLQRLLADASDDAPRLQDRYLLALCQDGLGRRDEALATLRSVLAEAEGDLLAEALVTAATILINEGRFDEAVPWLHRVVEELPQHDAAEGAAARLVVCLTRTGQFDRARQTLAELESAHPDRELLLETIEQTAEAAIDAGTHDWAQELFARLAEETPSARAKAAGLLGQGWSLYRAGQYEEAARPLDQLLAQDPEPSWGAEAALLCGRAWQARGRPDAALDRYGRVIDLYPDSPQYGDALWEAARIHDTSGRYEEAESYYARLATLDPPFVHPDAALYHWAWVLGKLGRAERAGDPYGRIHDEFPESRYWVHATLTLANLALESGREDAARQFAVELGDRDDKEGLGDHIYYLRGQLAFLDGHWQEARDMFDALLAEFPQSSLHALAQYGLAEAAFQQDDAAAATVAFEQIAETADGVSEEIAALAEMRLAQLHAQAGRFHDAYAVAADFAARHPDFSQQYEIDYVLGRCLAARAEFQAARDAYGRVIPSPAAAKAQLMIAETYFHQKKYEEAFREYLRVDILYDHPELQAAAVLQAAKCREKSEDWDDAAGLYRRLLEHYPDSPLAEQAQSQLQSCRAGRAEPNNGRITVAK